MKDIIHFKKLELPTLMLINNETLLRIYRAWDSDPQKFNKYVPLVFESISKFDFHVIEISKKID